MLCRSFVPYFKFVDYLSNDPSPEERDSLTETTLKMEIDEEDRERSIDRQQYLSILAMPSPTPSLWGLPERYLISEKKIIKGMKASDTFLTCLEKNYQIFKATFPVFEKNGLALRHKNGRTTEINAKQLMKVTAKALMTMKENSSTYFQLDRSVTAPQLLVTRQEDGSLVIGHKIRKLNEGSEGEVYLFNVLTEPVLMAAKFSLMFEEMKKEIDVLKAIYNTTRESKLTGLQDRMHSTFLIEEQNEFGNYITDIGYITHYYEKGWAYSHLLSPGLQGAEALRVIGQLFEGVRRMHALNLVHNDIDPRNLLVKVVKGKFEISLIDFGSAETSQSKEKRAWDIYDACHALYALLTGVHIMVDQDTLPCSKPRQELIAFRNECQASGKDFIECFERKGSFERHRLAEVGISDVLISLFEKVVVAFSGDDDPTPEEIAHLPTPETFIQLCQALKVQHPQKI